MTRGIGRAPYWNVACAAGPARRTVVVTCTRRGTYQRPVRATNPSFAPAAYWPDSEVYGIE